MASNKDFEKLRVKIIVRAWKDPRFKEQLLKNPRAAFKEMGVDLPGNIQVKAVEDKEASFTFVLPALAADVSELADSELEKIAAGRDVIRPTVGPGYNRHWNN